MAWDGNGVYSRIHNWVADAAASIGIVASRHDEEDDNLAAGIQACLTKNNESKPTANFLPNATNSYDLGGSSAQWKDVYYDGIVYAEGSIRFGEISDPTNAANKGSLYAKDSGGATELFYIDDSGNVAQLTNGGGTYIPGNDGALPSVSAGGSGVTAWIPRNYHSGLELTLGVDTDHDINIGVGECADSGNAYILKLTTGITKQIDAAFAAGDDQGGMATGSVAADTWYYLFLIRKDSDGSIDVMYDVSSSAANIPTGYTAFRLVGLVLTDGSANIGTIYREPRAGEVVYLDEPELLENTWSTTGTWFKTNNGLLDKMRPDYVVLTAYWANATTGQRIKTVLMGAAQDQTGASCDLKYAIIRIGVTLDTTSGAVMDNLNLSSGGDRVVNTDSNGQISLYFSATVGYTASIHIAGYGKYNS